MQSSFVNFNNSFSQYYKTFIMSFTRRSTLKTGRDINFKVMLFIYHKNLVKLANE